ncbi:hypothetical protein C8J56DRAFT_1066131 [Mycena floridula]|nr:hypothetical protein C8J56DRAFT_1066131 [Mycena floridula]
MARRGSRSLDNQRELISEDDAEYIPVISVAGAKLSSRYEMAQAPDRFLQRTTLVKLPLDIGAVKRTRPRGDFDALLDTTDVEAIIHTATPFATCRCAGGTRFASSPVQLYRRFFQSALDGSFYHLHEAVMTGIGRIFLPAPWFLYRFWHHSVLIIGIR